MAIALGIVAFAVIVLMLLDIRKAVMRLPANPVRVQFKTKAAYKTPEIPESTTQIHSTVPTPTYRERMTPAEYSKFLEDSYMELHKKGQL